MNNLQCTWAQRLRGETYCLPQIKQNARRQSQKILTQNEQRPESQFSRPLPDREFTVVDRAYGYASHKYGGPVGCANDARVPRTQIETGLLSGTQMKLLAPEFLDEFKKRVQRRLAAPKAKAVSYTARIAELTAETGRIADAIASGLLKPSAALGERLAIAEAELARVCAANEPAPRVSVEPIIPRMADEFRKLVEELPAILS